MLPTLAGAFGRGRRFSSPGLIRARSFGALTHSGFPESGLTREGKIIKANDHFATEKFAAAQPVDSTFYRAICTGSLYPGGLTTMRQ
jgi:hypothetical protein